MERVSEEDAMAIARCAARWWTNFLRVGSVPSLVHDAGYGKRSGRNSEEAIGGAFGDFLTTQLMSRYRLPTEEECQSFEDVLTMKVATQLHHGHSTGLHVDYGPDMHLSDAIFKSSINEKETNAGGRFPFKTDMYISSEAIEVSCGYGAGREPLYQTKRKAIFEIIEQRYSELVSPWYDEKRSSTDVFYEEREKIGRNYNHDWKRAQKDPLYCAAHNSMLLAGEPHRARIEAFYDAIKARKMSMPAVPAGSLNERAERLWSDLLAADEDFVSKFVLPTDENELAKTIQGWLVP